MTNTFIKRPELIEESYQTEDLLDFSSIIDDFKARINKINKNSVVGLIGPYGSGKSTMLYQIYKDQIDTDNNKNSENTSNQQTEKWFVFDAWQYPERKDLWEGFVLDIARQCDEKLFKKIENRVDGNTGKNKKAMIAAGADILSAFIPGASALKNLPYFFQTSPIKRVYEFQYLLLDILNKIDKDVFIVIEDIDRSGDMGVFFLETLKYFIKRHEKDLKHKVIVITPIGEEVWEKDGDKKIKDSYTKILDLKIAFIQEDIDFTNFINQVFDVDRILEIVKLKNNHIFSSPEIIISHLRYLFEEMILREQQTTIRDIKNILRKSESNFLRIQKEYRKEIDIRILIMFTAIEYFYQKEKNNKYTFSLKINSDSSELDSIITNNFWGKYLLIRIISGIEAHDKISTKFREHTWIHQNKQDDRFINIKRYGDRNTSCYINSNFFSVTGVKVTKL